VERVEIDLQWGFRDLEDGDVQAWGFVRPGLPVSGVETLLVGAADFADRTVSRVQGLDAQIAEQFLDPTTGNILVLFPGFDQETREPELFADHLPLIQFERLGVRDLGLTPAEEMLFGEFQISLSDVLLYQLFRDGRLRGRSGDFGSGPAGNEQAGDEEKDGESAPRQETGHAARPSGFESIVRQAP